MICDCICNIISSAIAKDLECISVSMHKAKDFVCIRYVFTYDDDRICSIKQESYGLNKRRLSDALCALRMEDTGVQRHSETWYMSTEGQGDLIIIG